MNPIERRAAGLLCVISGAYIMQQVGLTGIMLGIPLVLIGAALLVM